jgi:NAD(P)-dependent dehydrogenase (short-subunit alcohol dehydrogenase family)
MKALVTGATKGIGRDIAKAFAKAGCTVGATGRDEQDLSDLTDEITKHSGQCEIYRADLSNADEAIHMAEHFCTVLYPIDILVNNAGVSWVEKLIDLDVEHWNTILNVNLRAPALIGKVVARQMMERRKGVIINVASLASVTAHVEHAAYCASKFGLHGLTKVMAMELGPFNIRVNAVGPTVVMTPMGKKVWGEPEKSEPMKANIPLGRFAEPEDITHTVLFLASDAAGMINGELILVDGGYNAGK